ncbi:MAG: nucleotidyltransferase domain-containing protein [Candidatus Sungiibacteriota bacterium]
MIGDEKKLLILFGSRATGHARADSDWDVVVVYRCVQRGHLT